MENVPEIDKLQAHSSKMVGEDNVVRFILDNLGAIKSVLPSHFAVQEGKSFVFGTDFSLATTTSDYVLFKNDGKDVFLEEAFLLSDQANVEIRIFEDPVISADGTPLSIVNRNRILLTPTSVQAFKTPTVTSEGTMLQAVESKGGNQSITNQDMKSEWLLARGKNYLFKITNADAQTAEINFRLNWIETDG